MARFGTVKVITKVNDIVLKEPITELPINLDQGEPYPTLSEQMKLNAEFQAQHPGKRARVHIYAWKPFDDSLNADIPVDDK